MRLPVREYKYRALPRLYRVRIHDPYGRGRGHKECCLTVRELVIEVYETVARADK
jgi:hypothetical protein